MRNNVVWMGTLRFPVSEDTQHTVWLTTSETTEIWSVPSSLTSVKLQDTARPFLSTWGRRITSFPPWNNTKEGSCLDSGDADTLYLQRRIKCEARQHVHISTRSSLTKSNLGRQTSWTWENNNKDKFNFLLLGNLSVPSNVHFAKLEPRTVIPETQNKRVTEGVTESVSYCHWVGGWSLTWGRDQRRPRRRTDTLETSWRRIQRSTRHDCLSPAHPGLTHTIMI